MDLFDFPCGSRRFRVAESELTAGHILYNIQAWLASFRMSLRFEVPEIRLLIPQLVPMQFHLVFVVTLSQPI